MQNNGAMQALRPRSAPGKSSRSTCSGRGFLSQRTSNAGRRAALEAALKDIEAQLATLN
jgi:hypothetical protein